MQTQKINQLLQSNTAMRKLAMRADNVPDTLIGITARPDDPHRFKHDLGTMAVKLTAANSQDLLAYQSKGSTIAFTDNLDNVLMWLDDWRKLRLEMQSNNSYRVTITRGTRKLTIIDLRGYCSSLIQSPLDTGKKLLEDYWELWQINPFATTTLASLASKIYRRHYMIGSHKAADNGARGYAYFASRPAGMRVNKIGDYRGQFGLYDATSFYPNCLLQIGRLPNAAQWQYDRRLRPQGIYGAEITPPERDKFDMRGEQYLSGYELIALQSVGYRADIFGGYTFTGYAADPSYSQFVKQLLKLREKNRGNDHYKLVANSLIGKMAQTQSQPPSPRPAGSLHEPEIHALIIGYARAVMTRLIERYDPVYAATDSLLMPDNGAEFTADGIVFKRKKLLDRVVVAPGGRVFGWAGPVLDYTSLLGISPGHIGPLIAAFLRGDSNYRYVQTWPVDIAGALHDGRLGATRKTTINVNLEEWRRQIYG